MTKKKKIIAICLAIVAILISFIGGQTFSKYVTEVNGEGVANIAKWSFKVNDKEEQMQTINLGSTIDNNTLVENKIAPGTAGNFEIKIDAKEAEVGIDYKVRFINENNKPQNLIFTYQDKTYTNITKLEEVLTGTIDANAEEKEKTFNIHWEWPYETGIGTSIATNDKIDTENGKNIGLYTFDVLVEGVQVVPQN